MLLSGMRLAEVPVYDVFSKHVIARISRSDIPAGLGMEKIEEPAALCL